MPHRTDAVWIGSISGSLLSGPGCATFPRRDPAPPPKAAGKQASPVAVVPLPELVNAEALAITGPPRHAVSAPGEIRPAAYVAPPDDASVARRLHREAAGAYAKQANYIARLKRREWTDGRA